MEPQQANIAGAEAQKKGLNASGLSYQEVMELSAVDGQFFAYFFLPESFALQPAPFHRDVWDLSEDRNNPYTALEICRDGAKTTILRAYALKRAAFGISRTILFTSETLEHAQNSIDWISWTVKKNPLLRELFGIKIGETDNKSEVLIKHTHLNTETRITAKGMTGQLRGLNIRDARPDLIICDDPCNEENTATEEQRHKMCSLFYGALKNSLMARSQNPHSKMVLLQTGLHREDLINTCHSDPQWKTKKFSVFNEHGESAWPAKWSTKELLEEKQSYINRNQLSIWLREKECMIVSAETTAFRPEWLKEPQYIPDSSRMAIFIGIDPVPPPSDREIQVGLVGKDWECIYVIGYHDGAIYLLDKTRNRGHQPEWTVGEVLRLIRMWRPLALGVESHVYQLTLVRTLENELRKVRQYTRIEPVKDHRKKFQRFVDELTGYGHSGKLYVERDKFPEFCEQFIEYPGCRHDDDLDAVCCALMVMQDTYGGMIDNYVDVDTTLEDENEIADLPPMKAAP